MAYGIYETASCIASESEYRHDVYANAIENVLSNTTSCDKTIYRVLGM